MPLHRHPVFRSLVAVGFPAVLGIFLLIGRYFTTGSTMFFFLVWNLFLAGIPLALAMFLRFSNRAQKRWIFYPTLGAWLLFLPNAPYILTDLLHLRTKTAAPIWFDLTVILSFAWSGLLAGYYSLRWIQDLIVSRFRGRVWVGWSFAFLTIFASSYGIYLGRFLRWNSWDVLNAPGLLAQDIIHSLTLGGEMLKTYGFTLSFGMLLMFMYALPQLRPSSRKVHRA
ncbi:MAG: DUF1361 domain-containing protein [Flavobacteriales bacterium]|nr:DUF1361 domain-containing protein [Flavobacteriales bacterium]